MGEIIALVWLVFSIIGISSMKIDRKEKMITNQPRIEIIANVTEVIQPLWPTGRVKVFTDVSPKPLLCAKEDLCVGAVIGEKYKFNCVMINPYKKYEDCRGRIVLDPSPTPLKAL